MFSFNKSRRLLTKADYSSVFEQANKIVSSEYILLYVKNNIGFARLGLAISKKTVARANERNRIKRIFRESFRLKQLPAVDIVFLARNGITKRSNKEINNKLSQSWKKLIACCDI